MFLKIHTEIYQLLRVCDKVNKIKHSPYEVCELTRQFHFIFDFKTKYRTRSYSTDSGATAKKVQQNFSIISYLKSFFSNLNKWCSEVLSFLHSAVHSDGYIVLTSSRLSFTWHSWRVYFFVLFWDKKCRMKILLLVQLLLV